MLDKNRTISTYPDQFYNHDAEIVVINGILCEKGTGIIIHLDTNEPIYELVNFEVPLISTCAEAPDPAIPFA